MVILLAVLLGLTICFLFLWLISYLTLRDSYKSYKPSYLAIINKSYILASNSDNYITFTRPEDVSRYKKTMINNAIYFNKNSGIIKLMSNDYINKGGVFIFDPYSLYWYYKIKKTIFNYSKSIEEIREEKLNKIIG